MYIYETRVMSRREEFTPTKWITRGGAAYNVRNWISGDPEIVVTVTDLQTGQKVRFHEKGWRRAK
jgi:hypothetical protein